MSEVFFAPLDGYIEKQVIEDPWTWIVNEVFAFQTKLNIFCFKVVQSVEIFVGFLILVCSWNTNLFGTHLQILWLIFFGIELQTDALKNTKMIATTKFAKILAQHVQILLKLL